MKLITLVLIAILSLATHAFAESRTVRKEIRGPSGKLQYTTTTRGERTEVRDPSGKLIETRKKSGDRIEVRSPSGKLLKTIKNTE